jgi:diacylglycerol kinase family enzyme
MTVKSIAIVNPNSKGGQTKKNWDSIKDTLQKYFGTNLEFAFTEKSGDGTIMTRKYLEKGYENIIPIGGDGIINEVGNGFFKKVCNDKFDNIDLMTVEYNKILALTELEQIDSECTLTILPGGTRNVLVRSLGLPQDFEQCCKYVSESSITQKVDIISCVAKMGSEDSSGNRFRVFLNAAEIGLGAEIIEKGKMVRDQISSRILSTITSIVATLPVYKSNVCQIIEGSTTTHKIVNSLTTKMTMGMVSNGSFLGGGFQVATRADVADGLLDTILIKDSDSFKILQKLVNIKRGEEAIENEDDIYYGQSQTVSWLTDFQNNITVSLDGEPVGILPAFFRVHPRCLKIKL